MQSRTHVLIAITIALMLGQSACELASYIYSDSPETLTAYYICTIYYALVFATLTCFPLLAHELTERPINPYLLLTGIFAAACIIGVLLFTNSIIADVATIDYTLTRVPGDYYWVFQAGTITVFLYNIATLAGACRSSQFFARGRAFNLLIAFIPIFLFVVSVILAMALGVKINAVGAVPICMALYIAALIQNANPEDIPDYAYHVPFTDKWRMQRELNKNIRRLKRFGINFNKAEYEDRMIDYAVSMFGGNQKRAAEWLNISQSSMSKKIKKKNQSNN